ncbi:FAD-dependent oxidoreductase [Desulfobacterales bacterium HSG2]|nr:FAD-dependent oxidoreductase [Desulfobacterales bacterium HSG2]
MDVGRHPNIELLAYSEVEKVDGESGDFRITIRKKARYVDEEKCTGCGECAEKCPTVISDDYNMGLGEAKAIYRYFAQGIPSAYTIDANHCRQFHPKKKCGVCAKKCQAKAIDYDQQDQMIEVGAGAIIAATGYDLFDAQKTPQYGYGRIPNVITALELERLLSASGPTEGHLYRPSDLALQKDLSEQEKRSKKLLKTLGRHEKKFGQTSDEFYPLYESGELQGKDYDKWAQQLKEHRELTQEIEGKREKADKIAAAKRLAFIQCVGSRDIRFNRHCSSFCCMHSIKEAIIAREHDSEVEVSVFGMDIRAVGKGFEEYRNRGARKSGIRYIRSRVAEITENGDATPVVWYEDTLTREVRQVPADLVILATACEPASGVKQLAEILGIELNNFGFFKTGGSQPIDTTRPGVFTCGCAQGPMDIPESVAQASSAAARAAQILLKG